ncbi:MAG: YihY/virulence factor BrkB family protein [Rubrobacteraceae bacterium]
MGKAAGKARISGIVKRPVAGSITEFLSDMVSLLKYQTLKRTVVQINRDDIVGLAAQLAFYLTLGLFPFLLVIFSLLGTFSSDRFADELLAYFVQVLPVQVYNMIDAYIADILRGRNPAAGLLSFSIIGTLWVISNAFAALSRALNQAYDAEETRPFWKVRGLALLMALGLSGIVFVALVLLIAGPNIGASIAGYFGFGGLFSVFWSLAQWVVALTILVVTFALLYYFAPDVEQPFRWITPGGFIAVILWILASLGFRLYVNSDFVSYNETYGSIGAAVILLLYLYIVSFSLLVGAELNAVLAKMKEEFSGEDIFSAEPTGDESRSADDEAT